MSDVTATAVALNQAQTKHTAQVLMLKKEHEMQQSMIDMLAQSVEATKPPAPSGQGRVVDKSA
ncbi:putative motility protein [Pelagibacterium halotolerans]|uniref:putative motility protein n=1 Tax=Pelagibacterium halotolerans TaxID=531813 RepID=UPI00384E49CB